MPSRATSARLAQAGPALGGLLLVDDDAQGYTGPERLTSSPADVVFHSFGSIKTATCLGGGLARIKDPELLARMQANHARWPVHPTSSYTRKVALYTSLLAPREPHVYRLFAAACERLAGGLDRAVMGMTRGFPADDLPGFLHSLRRRPAAPMLQLLARRLGAFQRSRVEARAQAGEDVRRALLGRVEMLGQSQEARTHWLFAVLLHDPASHILPLRRAGFDAARGATSIAAIPAPDERPELAPRAAQRVMERILFLPVYPEIPAADRARLAEHIGERCRTPSETRVYS